MQFWQGFSEIVVRTVPVGGVTVDTLYVIGAEILYASKTAIAADSIPFGKRGGALVAVKSGDVPGDGEACYLNNTTNEVQATPAADVYLCGARNAQVPGDDGTDYIGVDLDGVVAKVYGVPGDIQGVTAGTGISGGGTSGTVTVSTDSSLIPTMPVVGGADELVLTAAGDRELSASGVTATDTAAAIVHTSSDGTDHANVVLNDTHRASDGTDHANVVLNDTHRAADGKDHSDVVLNNTHRTGDGSDHADVATNTAITAVAATMAAGAGAGDEVILSSAADRTQKTSSVLVGDFVAPARTADIAAAGGQGALAGTPVKIVYQTGTAAASEDIFDADCPWKISITGVTSTKITSTGAGSMKLNSGTVAAPGTDITDAVADAAQYDVYYPTSLNDSLNPISAGGNLSVIKANAGDAYMITIDAVIAP